jgi:dTDP-glucose 4,6-dehydratase
MKKIIITGGAGFIGSALVRFMVNTKGYKILNYDALKYSGNINSLKNIKKSSRYTFVKGDICNKRLVSKIIFKFRPNIIINCAAETHVDRSIENSYPFVKSNILGTHNLLTCSLNYFNSLDKKKKKNFLFHQVSTDEVYGDLKKQDPPSTELSSYAPSSPYSASKASADHMVMAWYRTYGLPTVITKCSNNYGPYQYPEKFIPHVIICALNSKKIPIYGNGKQIRDWIFVEDHIKALIKVFKKNNPGKTYNIGASNQITNHALALKICKILKKMKIAKIEKKNLKNLVYFVQDRPGHDKRYAINSSFIKRNLGWKETESFENGLVKTIRWYIKNQDWWKNILKKRYSLVRLGILKKKLN